ncbi:hypothetical protein C8A03DRAFT_31593 [Achaetomium macrosporum]|uniref:Uncharacterized protein n=1 Tax=Achaetomium macrosporum TaxID=79813 RepID=A0AAN7HFT1_9PEZI|nr:hypothetical protein C8A03DRAFT_31593 [Achaetomium macrosporum]
MGESELRFMESFKDLVNQYNAADLFGLYRHPGDDFGGLCEVTQGRANINAKPADWPKDLIALTLDTAWFFLHRSGLGDVDALATQMVITILTEQMSIR